MICFKNIFYSVRLFPKFTFQLPLRCYLHSLLLFLLWLFSIFYFICKNLVNSAVAFACFSFMFVRFYLLPSLLVFTAALCVSFWPHSHTDTHIHIQSYVTHTSTHCTHGTSGDLFTYFVCFHCIAAV